MPSTRLTEQVRQQLGRVPRRYWVMLAVAKKLVWVGIALYATGAGASWASKPDLHPQGSLVGNSK